MGYKWTKSSGSGRGGRAIGGNNQTRPQIKSSPTVDSGILPSPWLGSQGATPSDQNHPWPLDSGVVRPSHTGKGGLGLPLNTPK